MTTGNLFWSSKKKIKMVVCSRCGEVIKSGWDYRWHFDKHLDEYDSAVDKQAYVNETTRIMSSKFFSNK